MAVLSPPLPLLIVLFISLKWKELTGAVTGFILGGIFALEYFARRRALKSPASDSVGRDAARPIEPSSEDQSPVVNGETEDGKIGSA